MFRNLLNLDNCFYVDFRFFSIFSVFFFQCFSIFSFFFSFASIFPFFFSFASILHLFVCVFRAEKEWGDGIRGMSLTAARYALLRLEEGQPHTKNWRPQLLILAKPTDENLPKYRKLFSFASQLKAGKGLTMCVSVISGEFTKKSNKATETKQNIRRIMEEEKVKGFVEVLVARNIVDGLSSM